MKRLDSSGLTVVELIITIIVGVSLLTTLSSIVINQTTLAKRAKEQVLANSFAETKIEQLRSEGFNQLVPDPTPIDITSEMPSDLNPPRSSSYVVSDSSQNGLKQIDLTIEFSSQGNLRTLNFRTYIGELGVGQY